MLRRIETRIVVRTTLHDLALFRQVLAPGAQRVLNRAHGSIKHSAHFLPFIAYELGDQLPALRRVRFSGGERASDPFGVGDVGDGGAEASALAMRASQPSRRSSAAGGRGPSCVGERFKCFVFSRVPIGTSRRGYVPLNSLRCTLQPEVRANRNLWRASVHTGFEVGLFKWP